ncbi:MAG: S-layer homology domain-containing protein [Clostridiales bacterium]|nr:S-layer homology domain-containing protein [Clostridiales bacterium]
MTKLLKLFVLLAAVVLLSVPTFADMQVANSEILEDQTEICLANFEVSANNNLIMDNDNWEMQFLHENGIIKGDPNGDLRPNDELSRAEFATILCRAIGIEELAQSTAMLQKNYFSDIPAAHWAAGYINAAAEYKAINGFEDGTFRPGLSVTNEQVIKMLVAAWGYSEEAEKLGGYPNGYMEIAKRFEMIDAVLFNYGIASKRWVACSFTYGALAMPAAEDCPIESPVKTKQIQTKEPKPENTDYLPDPVSILKRITPKSAKYERTIFEQKVPDRFIPVEFQKNALLYNKKAVTGKAQFSFWQQGIRQAALEGSFSENDTADLSSLLPGQYQFHFTIIDGPVKDDYIATIVEKKDDGSLEFVSNIFRYTTLNAQAKITEIRHDITLSNSQSNSNNPFIIEALYSAEAKPILKVSYPYIVTEEQHLNAGINDIPESGEVHDLPVYLEGKPDKYIDFSTQPLVGQNAVLKPLIFTGFSFSGLYWLQIRIGYSTGDDVALSGTIKLIENGGKLDYLFEGVIRYLTIDGYEIIDYDE